MLAWASETMNKTIRKYCKCSTTHQETMEKKILSLLNWYEKKEKIYISRRKWLFVWNGVVVDEAFYVPAMVKTVAVNAIRFGQRVNKKNKFALAKSRLVYESEKESNIKCVWIEKNTYKISKRAVNYAQDFRSFCSHSHKNMRFKIGNFS